MLSSAVRSLISKWKEYGTNMTLPKGGCLPNFSDQKSRVTEGAGEIDTSDERIAIHRTTISEPDIKKGKKKNPYEFVQRHAGDSANMWFSGLIRSKCTFLAFTQSVMSGGSPTLLIALRTLCLQRSTVVGASRCGNVLFQQRLWNWQRLKRKKHSNDRNFKRSAKTKNSTVTAVFGLSWKTRH